MPSLTSSDWNDQGLLLTLVIVACFAIPSAAVFYYLAEVRVWRGGKEEREVQKEAEGKGEKGAHANKYVRMGDNSATDTNNMKGDGGHRSTNVPLARLFRPNHLATAAASSSPSLCASASSSAPSSANPPPSSQTRTVEASLDPIPLKYLRPETNSSTFHYPLLSDLARRIASFCKHRLLFCCDGESSSTPATPTAAAEQPFTTLSFADRIGISLLTAGSGDFGYAIDRFHAYYSLLFRSSSDSKERSPSIPFAAATVAAGATMKRSRFPSSLLPPYPFAPFLCDSHPSVSKQAAATREHEVEGDAVGTTAAADQPLVEPSESSATLIPSSPPSLLSSSFPSSLFSFRFSFASFLSPPEDVPLGTDPLVEGLLFLAKIGAILFFILPLASTLWVAVAAGTDSHLLLGAPASLLLRLQHQEEGGGGGGSSEGWDEGGRGDGGDAAEAANGTKETYEVFDYGELVPKKRRGDEGEGHGGNPNRQYYYVPSAIVNDPNGCRGKNTIRLRVERTNKDAEGVHSFPSSRHFGFLSSSSSASLEFPPVSFPPPFAVGAAISSQSASSFANGTNSNVSYWENVNADTAEFQCRRSSFCTWGLAASPLPSVTDNNSNYTSQTSVDDAKENENETAANGGTRRKYGVFMACVPIRTPGLYSLTASNISPTGWARNATLAAASVAFALLFGFVLIVASRAFTAYAGRVMRQQSRNSLGYRTVLLRGIPKEFVASRAAFRREYLSVGALVDVIPPSSSSSHSPSSSPRVVIGDGGDMVINGDSASRSATPSGRRRANNKSQQSRQGNGDAAEEVEVASCLHLTFPKRLMLGGGGWSDPTTQSHSHHSLSRTSVTVDISSGSTCDDDYLLAADHFGSAAQQQQEEEEELQRQGMGSASFASESFIFSSNQSSSAAASPLPPPFFSTATVRAVARYLLQSLLPSFLLALLVGGSKEGEGQGEGGEACSRINKHSHLMPLADSALFGAGEEERGDDDEDEGSEESSASIRRDKATAFVESLVRTLTTGTKRSPSVDSTRRGKQEHVGEGVEAEHHHIHNSFFFAATTKSGKTSAAKERRPSPAASAAAGASLLPSVENFYIRETLPEGYASARAAYDAAMGGLEEVIVAQNRYHKALLKKREEENAKREERKDQQGMIATAKEERKKEKEEEEALPPLQKLIFLDFWGLHSGADAEAAHCPNYSSSASAAAPTSSSSSHQQRGFWSRMFPHYVPAVPYYEAEVRRAAARLNAVMARNRRRRFFKERSRVRGSSSGGVKKEGAGDGDCGDDDGSTPFLIHHENGEGGDVNANQFVASPNALYSPTEGEEGEEGKGRQTDQPTSSADGHSPCEMRPMGGAVPSTENKKKKKTTKKPSRNGGEAVILDFEQTHSGMLLTDGEDSSSSSEEEEEEEKIGDNDSAERRRMRRGSYRAPRGVLGGKGEGEGSIPLRKGRSSSRRVLASTATAAAEADFDDGVIGEAELRTVASFAGGPLRNGNSTNNNEEADVDSTSGTTTDAAKKRGRSAAAHHSHSHSHNHSGFSAKGSVVDPNGAVFVIFKNAAAASEYVELFNYRFGTAEGQRRRAQRGFLVPAAATDNKGGEDYDDNSSLSSSPPFAPYKPSLGQLFFSQQHATIAGPPSEVNRTALSIPLFRGKVIFVFFVIFLVILAVLWSAPVALLANLDAIASLVGGKGSNGDESAVRENIRDLPPFARSLLQSWAPVFAVTVFRQLLNRLVRKALLLSGSPTAAHSEGWHICLIFVFFFTTSVVLQATVQGSVAVVDFEAFAEGTFGGGGGGGGGVGGGDSQTQTHSWWAVVSRLAAATVSPQGGYWYASALLGVVSSWMSPLMVGALLVSSLLASRVATQAQYDAIYAATNYPPIVREYASVLVLLGMGALFSISTPLLGICIGFALLNLYAAARGPLLDIYLPAVDSACQRVSSFYTVRFGFRVLAVCFFFSSVGLSIALASLSNSSSSNTTSGGRGEGDIPAPRAFAIAFASLSSLIAFVVVLFTFYETNKWAPSMRRVRQWHFSGLLLERRRLRRREVAAGLASVSTAVSAAAVPPQTADIAGVDGSRSSKSVAPLLAATSSSSTASPQLTASRGLQIADAEAALQAILNADTETTTTTAGGGTRNICGGCVAPSAGGIVRRIEALRLQTLLQQSRRMRDILGQAAAITSTSTCAVADTADDGINASKGQQSVTASAASFASPNKALSFHSPLTAASVVVDGANSAVAMDPEYVLSPLAMSIRKAPSMLSLRRRDDVVNILSPAVTAEDAAVEGNAHVGGSFRSTAVASAGGREVMIASPSADASPIVGNHSERKVAQTNTVATSTAGAAETASSFVTQRLRAALAVSLGPKPTADCFDQPRDYASHHATRRFVFVIADSEIAALHARYLFFGGGETVEKCSVKSIAATEETGAHHSSVAGAGEENEKGEKAHHQQQPTPHNNAFASSWDRTLVARHWHGDYLVNEETSMGPWKARLIALLILLQPLTLAKLVFLP